MASARFSLDLDPVGGGKVVINDEDVSDRIQGVHVDAGLRAPTVVTLYSHGHGRISGEGIVQVDAMPTDLGDHIAEWLGNLDPESVEKAAIDRSDFSTSLTPALLAVLADLARGKP